jgi:hypothetical protein
VGACAHRVSDASAVSALDGTEQVLCARADAGDEDAADRLAGLLADRGDLDGVRGLSADTAISASSGSCREVSGREHYVHDLRWHP